MGPTPVLQKKKGREKDEWPRYQVTLAPASRTSHVREQFPWLLPHAGLTICQFTRKTRKVSAARVRPSRRHVAAYREAFSRASPPPPPPRRRRVLSPPRFEPIGVWRTNGPFVPRWIDDRIKTWFALPSQVSLSGRRVMEEIVTRFSSISIHSRRIVREIGQFLSLFLPLQVYIRRKFEFVFFLEISFYINLFYEFVVNFLFSCRENRLLGFYLIFSTIILFIIFIELIVD